VNETALKSRPALAEAGHGLKAALRWWVSELGSLVGDQGPPAPARSDLVLYLGPIGTGEALTLIDRREETPRRYTLAADGDDLAERLAAIRGTARQAVSLTLLVDPALCFLRTRSLPLAVLPRMRDVLAQELEAATPFRMQGVYSDWYVEGEDADGLRVRHVVLKRARLDPILAVLAGAGLAAGGVIVGPSEDRAMPVDLLSGGQRPVPRLLRGLRASDAAAMALSAGLLLGAFGLLRAHQGATLEGLEAATFEARRAAPQRLAPPVQALASALAAERAARPPLAVIWSDLAAALPDTAFAEGLHLGPEGTRAILRTTDTEAALRALRTAPGIGAVVPREGEGAAGRLGVGLTPRPRTDSGVAPVPQLRP
jgi:general secretion pathway protein L